MKKFYFLAAIAAVVLGSCTSEEVLNQPSGLEDEASAIGFSTFLDRAPQNGVRPLASVMDKTGLQKAGAGFTVLAYSTGAESWTSYESSAPAEPNFMNNQTVEWDAGTWTYSPIKYWPKAGDGWGQVTFFGFSTVTGATAAGVIGGNPQISFETAASVTSQVDLVADMIEDKTKDDGKVQFAFNHILSRIGFKAKLQAAYEAATVTVTSLKVYYKDDEVISSGTYTFETGWAPGTDKFTAGNLEGGPIFSGTSETLTTTAGTFTDQYLMLIPQEIDEGDIYVELEYKVATGTGTNGSVDNPSVTIKLPATSDLPSAANEWEQGKAYTYTLSISLYAVEFDENISVNPWDDEPDIDV
jgi:hypothetical protein